MRGFSFLFNKTAGVRQRIADRYVSASGINGSLRLRASHKQVIRNIKRDHRDAIRKYAAANSDYLELSRRFLEQNFCGYRDTSWHLCYAWANGIRDEKYIPEDIFYGVIVRRVNEYRLKNSIADKNTYQNAMPQAPTPRTAFRIIHGRLLDADNQPTSWESLGKSLDPAATLVLKPSTGGYGGLGISIDNAAAIIALARSRLAGCRDPAEVNYICQHCLAQHPSLAQLYPSSVNTIRTMTFRNKGRIVPLSSVLRMGRGQMKIDNLSAGGIGCGITADGSLKKYAYDRYFNRFTGHPDTLVRFEGFSLPGWRDAVKMSIALHGGLQMFDLVSWDMAVDEAGKPCMIEFNLGLQGIDLHQINNGPVFGPFTAEMIERLGLG